MADNIVLAKYKADVKDALKSIDQLDKKVNKLDKDTKKSSKDMQSSFTSAFSKIGAAAGIAFGTQQLVSFGKEAVKVAAQFEGVERAFKRIGGANSANLLKGLRDATRGTVSDLQLMQKAVQASNFKIPLENLASLFKFAQARARETGESVEYLTNSIVLGIGRKSPLILDNLGISAVELRKRLKGVGVEAANVGDIAAIIGEIAEEELAKMGDQADTTADKLEQMNVVLENTKAIIGKELILEVANLSDDFSGLTEQVNRLVGTEADISGWEKVLRFGLRSLTTGFRVFGAVGERALLIINNVGAGMKELAENAKIEAYRLTISGDELERFNELGRTAQLILIRRSSATEDYADFTNDAIKATELFNKATADAGGEGGATEVYTRSINKLSEELKGYETQLKDAEIGSSQFFSIIDKITDKTKELNEAIAMTKLADALKVDEEEMPDISGGVIDYAEEVERQTDIADERWEAHFQKLMQEQDAAFENDKKNREAQIQLAYEGVNTIASIASSIYQIQQNAFISEQQELEKQLEQGLITREKYDRELKEINQKQAQANKDAAIFQATISTAQAVVNALGSFPFSPANIALAAAIGAAGAAQIAAIASQPLPQFAEGGWVDADGKLVGRSHAQGGIKLEAEGGEYIVNKIQSKKHAELIESINSGRVEDYIASKYIIPTVQQIDGQMAGMAASAALNGFNDMNLLRAFDRNRQSEKANAKYIVSGVVNGLKRGGSRWN